MPLFKILGKLVVTSSGLITLPESCAGDIYQDRFVFSPSGSFECTGDNFPDNIRVESSKTSITGKCSSECFVVEAAYQVVGSQN